MNAIDMTSSKHSEVMFGVPPGVAGLDIAHLSANGKEKEVLFLAGADSSLKAFDIGSRKLVLDCVIELPVSHQEEEICALRVIHAGVEYIYVAFGSATGTVCMAKVRIVDDDKFILDSRRDVFLVYKSSANAPIRDIQVLQTSSGLIVMGIATTDAGVKLVDVSLSKLENMNFEDIVSVDKGSNVQVQSIRFGNRDGNAVLYVSTVLEDIHIWDLRSLDFMKGDSAEIKFVGKIGNVFERTSRSAQGTVSELWKNNFVVSSDGSVLFASGRKEIVAYCTKTHQLLYSLNASNVGNAKFNNVILSKNGRLLFASSEKGNIFAFDTFDRKEVVAFDLEEPCQAIGISSSGILVTLLESGDFWILDKPSGNRNVELLSMAAPRTAIRQDNPQDSSSSLVEEVEDAPLSRKEDEYAESRIDIVGESSLAKRRMEIREEIGNLGSIAHSNIDIDQIAKRVATLLHNKEKKSRKDYAEEKVVLQPGSTVVLEAARKDILTYLDWNNNGQLIRSVDRVDVKFADMDRKAVSIDSFALQKNFTLGCLGEEALVLCTQTGLADDKFQEMDVDAGEVVYPKPFHKFLKSYQLKLVKNKDLQKEKFDVNKSVLAEAFEKAEQAERNNAFKATEGDQGKSAEVNTIFFKMLSKNTFEKAQGSDTEFQLDLSKTYPHDMPETPLLCALGADFIAIATDELNLRIIRHSSVQEIPVKLSKFPFSMAARGSKLFIVYNSFSTPQAESEFICSCELFEVHAEAESRRKGTFMSLVSETYLPITGFEGSKNYPRWVGFSAEDFPCVYFRKNAFYGLITNAANRWVHLHLDTKNDMSDNLWPISVQKGILLGIKLAGEDEAPRVGNNALQVEKSEISFNILGIDKTQPNKAGTLKFRLEEQLWQKDIFSPDGNSQQQDIAIDELLIKQVILSIKLGKLNRAIGFFKRIETESALATAEFNVSSVKDQSFQRIIKQIVNQKKLSNQNPDNHLATAKRSSAEAFALSPINTISQTATYHTQDNEFSFTESKLGDDQSPRSPGQVTPRLARQSTFSKEARENSLKKQRLL